MGHFYDSGLVVASDKAEAVRWFKRAFLGGLLEAEKELARLNAMGVDGAKQPNPAHAAAAPASTAAHPQDNAEPAAPSQPRALYAHRSSASGVHSTMQLRAHSKERGHK